MNAGAAANHTYDSIENAVGSNYADVIVGNSSANKLFGNGGNDTIAGNGGNDTLNGGAGQDTFVGLLSGTVTVTGGADRDNFDFRVGASDFDLTVTDFDPFFFNGNTQVAPAQATARNDMIHEFFHLSFDPLSGADTAQKVRDFGALRPLCRPRGRDHRRGLGGLCPECAWDHHVPGRTRREQSSDGRVHDLSRSAGRLLRTRSAIEAGFHAPGCESASNFDPGETAVTRCSQTIFEKKEGSRLDAD